MPVTKTWTDMATLIALGPHAEYDGCNSCLGPPLSPKLWEVIDVCCFTDSGARDELRKMNPSLHFAKSADTWCVACLRTILHGGPVRILEPSVVCETNWAYPFSTPKQKAIIQKTPALSSLWLISERREKGWATNALLIYDALCVWNWLKLYWRSRSSEDRRYNVLKYKTNHVDERETRSLPQSIMCVLISLEHEH